MDLLRSPSRWILNPLWDLKDGSRRLSALRELRRSQWLSQAQLETMQRKRLAAIVRHAYKHSPYYRQLFDTHGVSVDPLTPDDFFKIPHLTKKLIRERTNAMICEGRDKSQLSYHKTGGSTGTSLTTYFDLVWEQRRAADAMRANEWAGWYAGAKVFAIWGNPPVARTWKQKVRSRLRDRIIYFDTMHITEETLSDFVRTFRKERPQILFGHAHSLFVIARHLIANGVANLRPDGIVSTSMMLLPSERAVIERAFTCPVTDRYGCEEVALIACECAEHAGLHLNVESLYVELLGADGRPVAPGEEGGVVVTDLFNEAMPLIRYRVEDVAVPSARACPCGRGLPLIERVVGRVADYLRRPDGSQVAGVSLVERTLTAVPGIEQMQIVQPTSTRLILNLVKAGDFSVTTEARLREEFAAVFTPAVTLEFRYLDSIPRERSGKYRFSICALDEPGGAVA